MQTERASNNIAELLRERSLADADSFALRTAKTELTFAEVYKKVAALALELKEYGVSKGDVVALSLQDPLEHFIAFMSVVHQGAVTLSLSQSTSTLLQRTLLEQTDTKFVLYSQEDETPELRTQRLISINLGKLETDALTDFPTPVAVSDDDPWQIAHGSGSTGAPKLLIKTHRQQRVRFEKAKDWLPITSDDTFLSLSSIHFSASKGFALQAWGVGACVYLGEPGQLDFSKEVDTGSVTAIYGTPQHMQMLLKLASRSPTRPFEKLNALILTSAPVPMSMRADIKNYLTDKLYVVWGTNEASVCSVTSLDSVFVTDQTVGRILPWVTIQIVDDNDNELKLGQSGNIRIKTDALIDGYQGDDAATRATFKDGWFYPKDIAHLTEDGQLIFHGRSDHMMIVGGVNVHPLQVENILLKDPDIYDAHVTSIDHPSAGESPLALLVPATARVLDLEKIVENVRSEIGAHSLHFAACLDELPRTEQGKLPKKEVDRLIQYLFKNPFQSASRKSKNISFSFIAEIKASEQERLRQWIDFLATPHTRLLNGEDEAQDQNSNAGRRWLKLVISLTHLLLHLIKAPVSERILINRCFPDDADQNKWKGEIVPPSTDLVPQAALRKVMRVAFNLASALTRMEPTDPKHKDAAYKEIFEKVVQQFPNGVTSGLSSFEVAMKAQHLGIRTKILPKSMIQLGWGRNSRVFDRSGIVGDSYIGAKYSGDKFDTARVLRLAGLPTPTHLPASSLEEAQKAAKLVTYPLVIKPADGERGEGVTTNVTSGTLETAFASARKYSKSQTVLVEKQVIGICHRIFIAGGKLLYAVKRLPIGVYTDGESSIAELVEASYKESQLLAP